MLIVQRRVGQRIVVGQGIEIVVTNVGRGGVRLGVIAPRGVAVLRGEVYDAIVAENLAAAASADVDEHAFDEPVATPAPNDPTNADGRRVSGAPLAREVRPSSAP
jgi:carbon storage regulator